MFDIKFNLGHFYNNNKIKQQMMVQITHQDTNWCLLHGDISINGNNTIGGCSDEELISSETRNPHKCINLRKVFPLIPPYRLLSPLAIYLVLQWDGSVIVLAQEIAMQAQRFD